MQRKMKVSACVRSGTCCKKAPCGFGEWNTDKTQCTHLESSEDGLHSCGIYSEIIKDPTSVVSPAFGSGCCMSMGNVARNDIIKSHHNGEIPYVEIDCW